MIIARVIGRVVATRRHDSLHAQTLLLVEPEDCHDPTHIVAVDSVGAGPGDRVLIVSEGRAASTAVGANQNTIDTAVIGIIDPNQS